MTNYVILLRHSLPFRPRENIAGYLAAGEPIKVMLNGSEGYYPEQLKSAGANSSEGDICCNAAFRTNV